MFDKQEDVNGPPYFMYKKASLCDMHANHGEKNKIEARYVVEMSS